MKIDVISDTICPWCFIGKRRLERALAEHPELEPEIVWHPFQLNPEMPPEGMDREMYLQVKFGGPTRAKEVYGVIARAASSEALDFKLDKIGNSKALCSKGGVSAVRLRLLGYLTEASNHKPQHRSLELSFQCIRSAFQA